ncbi:MAG: flagellar export chaperone FliS [Proteobacteria bacterium]|nr:MAG: flagellar export chaperone FliS [Pseudomonadota bacterium]
MNAARQYQQVGTQTSIIDADPHKLIQLLLEGALERMAMAKSRITAKDFEGKNNLLNKSIEIVAGLRSFLDHSRGGEISTNLESLYDYIERRLLEANVRNDVTIIDECSHLIRTVKEGWDGIREEVLAKKLV